MKHLFLLTLITLFGMSSCNNQTTEKCDNKPAVNLTGSELKIIAEINLKADAVTAMKPIFEKVIAGSQAEEGCLYYNLHQDIADTTGTKYVMVEIWKDQAAIDTHNESTHFKTFVQSSEGQIDNMKVSILKLAK